MLSLVDARARRGAFTLAADLDVEAGARVAVMGASGSGKSTLLDMIAGFVPLERGRVRWGGADLTGLPPGDRPISVLFQDSNLFPHLTAERNVGLGIRPDLRLGDGERARVAEALASVGLEGLGDRRPSALSGGQRSRVALARLLVQARPLALVDEPFAALGPALREEMLDLMAALLDRTGATLLMVTHAPGDARRLCPQTVIVEEGRAHEPVPTGPLLDDPPEGLRRYLGEAG